jgi:hypothetical protein
MLIITTMGISQICKTIKDFFQSTRPPVQQLPRLLLACSLQKRPGLSAVVSVANIVKDLNMMGIPTGPMPDGSPNLTVAHAFAVTKEVFRALKLDAVVQVTTGCASLNIQAGPYMGTNISCGNETTNGQIM